MIVVRYRDQLGNRMFQYALGRILAEKLGFMLSAEPLDWFPRTASKVDGVSSEAPEQLLEGQKVDLDNVLSDRSPRRIVLDGWFQRREYYEAHRDEIRRWFEFGAGRVDEVGQADIIVHVRRSDYVQNGSALPFSFYQEAIDRALSSAGRVKIATDDPNDPFLKRFRRWPSQVLHGSAAETLFRMTRAPCLILSQSTFAWWGAFLAPEAQRVICPKPATGFWSDGSPHAIDLIDPDRFEVIPCREADVPSPSEARYQMWRQFKRRVVNHLNRRYGARLMMPR